MKPRLIAAALFGCTLLLASMYWMFSDSKTRYVQLSERPDRFSSDVQLPPQPGTLGLDLQIPYTVIRNALQQTLDRPQSGQGEKQTCKKILFNNVCATVTWQYTITQTGAITIDRQDSYVRLGIPLSLEGTVGVNGKSARLLGLSSKDISAGLLLYANVKTQMLRNWCPVLNNTLEFSWIDEPEIRIAGDLSINLRKAADKALNKRKAKLEKQLTEAIDCGEFRDSVKRQWKTHHLPLKLGTRSPAYVAISPQSAHIGDSKALQDALQISIEISTTTEVVTPLSPGNALPLPDLTDPIAGPGTVDFNLLLKLPYEDINHLLLRRLSETPDNTQKFKITSVEVYPAGTKLVFAVQFSNTAMSRFLPLRGEFFITTTPSARPQSNTLSFDDINYTRIVNSTVFNVVSATLHNRILDALRKNSVIDLKPHLTRLENSVVRALSDSSNTSGLQISPSAPVVKLISVNPETDALAIVMNLSTTLKAAVQLETLIK